ncbi:hypothetical protein GTP56_19750 [Duganella sp. FT134W]|uniref:Uncharacterized protein n=1 Tax=Duganella margarita TaxID=2692170 RepID=A0A7X4KID8_9BURK|nr:hypothetical protein [Duganella margarita]MYM74410.1 hypothetical protein [Duganella margarita]
MTSSRTDSRQTPPAMSRVPDPSPRPSGAQFALDRFLQQGVVGSGVRREAADYLAFLLIRNFSKFHSTSVGLSCLMP